MENEKEINVKEAQVDYNRYYTYTDYVKWDNDTRWELIDGTPYAMSAPSRRHQKISIRLIEHLLSFLNDKPCEVYHAPFDVRLNPDTKDDTVVQPDIVVICDPNKLTDAGCDGAPDMVIEILSQSTSNYDRITKFNKYRECGVREYWIVDPETNSLSVHILKGEDFIIHAYSAESTVPIRIIDDCVIDLSKVFED